MFTQHLITNKSISLCGQFHSNIRGHRIVGKKERTHNTFGKSGVLMTRRQFCD